MDEATKKDAYEQFVAVMNELKILHLEVDMTEKQRMYGENYIDDLFRIFKKAFYSL